MAETWRITPGKRLALATVDAVARPFSRLFHPRVNGDDGIWKILVVELWNIGDVVIATTALQALRARYPDAWIAFLGKPHAEEVLRGTGLVDEVITYDFPWTSETDKYQRSRYDRRSLKELFRRLREEKYDLTIDCRMDFRSNLVTYATRAKRRVGYAFGGGSFLLTDAISAAPLRDHKVRDWLRLLEALGSRRGASLLSRNEDGKPFVPHLTLLPEERQAAAAKLEEMGIAPRDLIIAVHVGASNADKRWPSEKFAQVADSIADSYGAKIVVLVDPEGYGANLPLRNPAIYLKSGLRELMALIGSCDLLLCNDSAPMHIADALGVPVVAVFTTGNPRWYGPSGKLQRVVGKGAPRGKRVDVPVGEVLAAAQAQIERAITARAKAYGAIQGSTP
ncbi:MAG TPA: glycosyltransferase family 9 protein [Gemmatimonadaceae bacterium]|nr:glycosyltransferase family 9 protein [Gemmatimonadaceae bacterium]